MFEKYLEDRWGYGRKRGYQLMQSAEFMQIAEKIVPENVAQKDELCNISESILPKNERQIRPLLEKLKHNGERIKVWCEVIGTGEIFSFMIELSQLFFIAYNGINAFRTLLLIIYVGDIA